MAPTFLIHLKGATFKCANCGPNERVLPQQTNSKSDYALVVKLGNSHHISGSDCAHLK